MFGDMELDLRRVLLLSAILLFLSILLLFYYYFYLADGMGNRFLVGWSGVQLGAEGERQQAFRLVRPHSLAVAPKGRSVARLSVRVVLVMASATNTLQGNCAVISVRVPELDVGLVTPAGRAGGWLALSIDPKGPSSALLTF